jgi:hypothetical protein
MRTQLRFDLDGLAHAIESGDARYQLALYTDDAEVRIIQADDPHSSEKVIQGKEAIGNWIKDLATSGELPKVVNRVVVNGRLAIVEEIHQPDGTQLQFECSAEVHRGQILKETVTLTGNRSGQRDGGKEFSGTDHQPPSGERGAPTSPRLVPRQEPNLPFFGSNLPSSIFLG